MASDTKVRGKDKSDGQSNQQHKSLDDPTQSQQLFLIAKNEGLTTFFKPVAIIVKISGTT